MSAEPVDYSDVQQAVVYVRVPGWLHNLIVRAAEGRGLSVNQWCAGVLLRAAEGVPAGVEVVSVPSVADRVEGVAAGRVVLEPCGRPSPCERMTAGTHRVGGFEYCNHCRVRVG
jgi:hypothetical protein